MPTLDAIIASAPSKARFAGPVSEREVAAAEATLGVHFPDDYRGFLLTHGCGNIGPIEVLGLGVPDTAVPSLLYVVRSLAGEGFATTPTLLPFSPIGDGSWSALVTGPLRDLEPGTVVTWDPSEDSVEAGLDRVQSASFADWLAGQIARLHPLSSLGA